MNILFFCLNKVHPQIGGVESITHFMCNHLIKRGNNIHIVYFNHNELESSIKQVQLPNIKKIDNRENVDFLFNYLIHNKINVVINQFALSPRLSYICNIACERSNTKLVSVIHNMPDTSLRVKPFSSLIYKCSILKKFTINIWAKIEIILGKRGGYYQQKISDKIVLLSEKYEDIYKKINSITDNHKLIVIPNPLIIDKMKCDERKENLMLFVGRLGAQKNLLELLKIWQLFSQQKHSDEWQLIFVGEGEDRFKLENFIKRNKLYNVKLVGRCDPTPYYQKAKILCLTSTFEGFPITLIECQCFGVVPVVYHTFDAASDIIEDGFNGFLIKANDKMSFVDRLIKLTSNSTLLNVMSENTISRTEFYDPVKILKIWDTLLADFK